MRLLRLVGTKSVRGVRWLVRPSTLAAALPRFGAAALVAALLAVAPAELSREPRDGGGTTQLVMPPGDAGESPQPSIEGLDSPSAPAANAKMAAYAAEVTSTGIPQRALQSYVRAAAALRRTDPDCGLRWSLLAAIGRVESDHGRFAGRALLSDGTSTSPIIGVALDGSGPVALIRDTDGGRLDGDTVYDRAVGPMQFIPSTWTHVASDGDGDGVRDPHDLDDASVAAGRYLCAYGSLSTPAGLRAAVLRYNPSSEYADLVLRIMDLYERGLSDQLPRPGKVPTTEPAPKPPLPPANVEPPPRPSGGQGGPGGGGAGEGDGDTQPPSGGHPTTPPTDDPGTGGGGGTGGGDGGSGDGGGGTGGGTPSPSPSDEPTPCPTSSTETPSPTPTPTETPSPTPSGSPTDDPCPTDGQTGESAEPEPTPSPSP